MVNLSQTSVSGQVDWVNPAHRENLVVNKFVRDREQDKEGQIYKEIINYTFCVCVNQTLPHSFTDK